MPVRVRIPRALSELPQPVITVDPSPADVGRLVAELDRLFPGLARTLDSASVNAAVNGEVVLHGRDATPLEDGDEVEFLVMFAGGS